MIPIKIIPIGDISVISELIAYTQNFINEICGLIGLAVGIVEVTTLLYIRKRRHKKL